MAGIPAATTSTTRPDYFQADASWFDHHGDWRSPQTGTRAGRHLRRIRPRRMASKPQSRRRRVLRDRSGRCRVRDARSRDGALASSINQFHQANPRSIFNKQVMWAALGLVGLWIGMTVPYHFWRRLVLPRWSVVRHDAAAVRSGLGDRVNEANAWSRWPAVLAAIGVLEAVRSVVLRQPLAKRRDRDGRSVAHAGARHVRRHRWCRPVLVQSDLGSAIVLASIVFVIAFIAGAPMADGSAAGMGRGALAFVVSSPRGRPGSPRSSTSPPTRTTSATRPTRR